jgi:ectoine hydroxylase-related dioxygenase (phytanoyl-CoA dioxygenase family)
MLMRVRGYFAFDQNEDAPENARHLERFGYCIAPSVFTDQEVAELANEINEVFEQTPRDQRAGEKRSAEEDESYRYEMLNRSALSQSAINHPEIRGILSPLLGRDFHIIANTAWRNAENQESQHSGQAWHIDAGPHIPLADDMQWPDNIPHPVFAVGAHIFLKDCKIEDGPTGVISGSHLSGQFPTPGKEMDPDLSYREQKVTPLLAKAGDVAMFVSDIWHRRMPSLPGDQGRFFLQAHYGRRDIAQRLRTSAQSNQLSEAAIQRASSKEERSLIGLHSPGFYDG